MARSPRYSVNLDSVDPEAELPSQQADPYGPSDDNRLTLVSAASNLPWDDSSATVVVAVMNDPAFEPTPQNGKNDAARGTSGDTGAWPLIILYGVLFVGTVVGTVVLYRRWTPLSTYLLTTPAFLATIVLTTEAVTRLLPSWL